MHAIVTVQILGSYSMTLLLERFGLGLFLWFTYIKDDLSLDFIWKIEFFD